MWERGSILGITQKLRGWKGCISGLGGFLDGWGLGGIPEQGGGQGQSQPRGVSPSWCPHAAWPGMGTSLPTQQQQQSRLWAGSAAPQEQGRHYPHSGHCRHCPLQRSPVPPGSPSRDADMAGEGRTPWGHSRDTPRHPESTAGLVSGAKERTEGTPGDTSGQHGYSGRPCPQHWEKNGAPPGESPGMGEGWSTQGMHLEAITVTRRRMGRLGESSPGMGKGWGTPRMQLWSWEQDRAPQGCTQSPSSLLGEG